MANSKVAIAKVVKEEGGYQAGKADSGNYYKGKLLGTKYGITPNAYFAYYKKEPVQDTIKNLTVDQAIPIYKKNYWDKIRGDEIKNDSVADLMMFIVVNSGVGMIKSLKHIMNEAAGKKIVAETSTPFTIEEIKLLNALPQDVYFKKVKAWREGFYKALAQKKPSNQVFLKGWLNRLNKHTYSGAVSKSTSPARLILLGLLLFGGSAVIAYRYS